MPTIQFFCLASFQQTLRMFALNHPCGGGRCCRNQTGYHLCFSVPWNVLQLLISRSAPEVSCQVPSTCRGPSPSLTPSRSIWVEKRRRMIILDKTTSGRLLFQGKHFQSSFRGFLAKKSRIRDEALKLAGRRPGVRLSLLDCVDGQSWPTSWKRVSSVMLTNDFKYEMDTGLDCEISLSTSSCCKSGHKRKEGVTHSTTHVMSGTVR